MKSLYNRMATGVACIAAVLALSACATTGKMWDKTSGNQPPPSPAPQPPGAKGEIVSSVSPVPYSLSADCVGSCVNFTLTNSSPADMVVNPEHFAMIPQGTRRVVPYDSQSATVDVPATVAPGATVTGRAVFKEFANPTGNKLVFKPDATGTYATIGGSGGARSASTAAIN